MNLIKAVGYYTNIVYEKTIYDNGIYVNLDKCVHFRPKTVFDPLSHEYYACIITTEEVDSDYNRVWIINIYNNKENADKKVERLCNELFRRFTVIS